MDGNDLNPVINTKAPAMAGPDPRPRTEMPTVRSGMAAQPGVAPMASIAGTAPVAGTPGQMATQPGATPVAGAVVQPGVAPMAGTPTLSTPNTAEALNTPVASDDGGKISAEARRMIQKVVVLVLVAVCTGFAVLALAIVVLTNIPRIAELENRMDAIVLQNETMKDQIATLSRRIGYDIDVTFFDGGMPGTTYSVTLQPETREVIVATYEGCSLTDITGCDDEPDIARILLSVSEYDLVVAAYNNMDGSAVNYTKNMLAWTNAIMALIGADATIADTNSHDWEIIKIYDADGDGTVSSREYGTYLLTQMIK